MFQTSTASQDSQTSAEILLHIYVLQQVLFLKEVLKRLQYTIYFFYFFNIEVFAIWWLEIQKHLQ